MATLERSSPRTAVLSQIVLNESDDEVVFVLLVQSYRRGEPREVAPRAGMGGSGLIRYCITIIIARVFLLIILCNNSVINYAMHI